MSILDRLERKLGRFAVPNLMKYICVMYALGFMIQIFAPEFYYYYLDLDPEAILHGHIWRILTFLIFYPASTGFGSIFWAVIGIMVYYSIGRTLEYLWGNFRYNFFFFSGVILYNVAGILIYLVTGVSLQLNPTYMGFSIFLAYALTLPDTVFYLYFFIPIKAKYLAALETLLYLYLLLVSPSLGGKLSIVLSFANVLLFFFLMNQGKRKNIFNIRNYR
ncbi:hypothetical protein [Oribacterium parvum]|uniref:hypothetical protein n=1 Tax=Oribacterium parvum TaxID=1501329 RepID=UPI0028ED3700|nr:hypothetical protein [Oribacterium parvum]